MWGGFEDWGKQDTSYWFTIVGMDASGREGAAAPAVKVAVPSVLKERGPRQRTRPPRDFKRRAEPRLTIKPTFRLRKTSPPPTIRP